MIVGSDRVRGTGREHKKKTIIRTHGTSTHVDCGRTWAKWNNNISETTTKNIQMLNALVRWQSFRFTLSFVHLFCVSFRPVYGCRCSRRTVKSVTGRDTIHIYGRCVRLVRFYLCALWCTLYGTVVQSLRMCVATDLVCLTESLHKFL